MLLVWLAILVVVTRVLASIPAATLAEVTWNIYKRFAPSEELRSLREKRQKLVEVRAERASTSSQDEFAKWARLDRQHQALKKELDVINANVAVSRQRIVGFVGIFRWFATTGVKFYVQWKFRAVPVVWLPPNNGLPRLVEWFLSLPKAPKGSISTASWVVLSDGAVSCLLRIYKLAKAARSGAVQATAVPGSSGATTSSGTTSGTSAPSSPRKTK